MLKRLLSQTVESLLDRHPAVVLTGPRQVGKTTLALEIGDRRDAVYLDLESPSDAARVSDIEQYCAMHEDRLLILDEVQRFPELFAPLRGIIDQRRRAGQRTGQFLLLGSASIDLLQQCSETLAGRIAQCELQPLQLPEVENEHLHALWLRGGFPDSFQAGSDTVSLEWRNEFIRSYLERDIPQLGPRVPAETLRRFWSMLAHKQGQTFNASEFARGLDVTGVSASRYLDLLVDLLLVRRLAPWTSNMGRRLVKSPKTYIRDSGICHALLGIRTVDDLLGHPVSGGSWEGMVIEHIVTRLPLHASFGFYRTAGGAEVDLVVDFGSGERWAIEIKRSTAPALSRGFHTACEDIQPSRRLLVHGGADRFPVKGDIEALPLNQLLEDDRLTSGGDD